MTQQRARHVSRLPTTGQPPGPVHLGMREVPGMVCFQDGARRPVSLAGPMPPPQDTIELANNIESLLRGPRAVMDRLPDGETPLPLITIDELRAEATSLARHYDEVIVGCLERVAMLGRHRSERPLAERAEAERRLLAQIDAMVEAGITTRHLFEWWEEEAEDEAEWGLWAAVFTLGLFSGGASLEAIVDLIEGQTEGPAELPVMLGEALLISPHRDRGALARDLVASEAPIARATGLEILSRSGSLELQAALDALEHDSPFVVAAAIRALGRSSDPAWERAASSTLHDKLCHDDADVCWQAARALTLWGQPEPLARLRERAPLCEVLGERALELFVMAGAADDLAVMLQLCGRLPASPALLSAVARFGDPTGWGYLVDYLADGDLEDEALIALQIMFGSLVAEQEELDRNAWELALSRAELVPGSRIRAGQPWSLETVIAECSSGELSRTEVELRLDELRARTGIVAEIDLAHFEPQTKAALGGLEARYRGQRLRRGLEPIR